MTDDLDELRHELRHMKDEIAASISWSYHKIIIPAGACYIWPETRRLGALTRLRSFVLTGMSRKFLMIISRELYRLAHILPSPDHGEGDVHGNKVCPVLLCRALTSTIFGCISLISRRHGLQKEFGNGSVRRNQSASAWL